MVPVLLGKHTLTIISHVTYRVNLIESQNVCRPNWVQVMVLGLFFPEVWLVQASSEVITSITLPALPIIKHIQGQDGLHIHHNLHSGAKPCLSRCHCITCLSPKPSLCVLCVCMVQICTYNVKPFSDTYTERDTLSLLITRVCVSITHNLHTADTVTSVGDLVRFSHNFVTSLALQMLGPSTPCLTHTEHSYASCKHFEIVLLSCIALYVWIQCQYIHEFCKNGRLLYGVKCQVSVTQYRWLKACLCAPVQKFEKHVCPCRTPTKLTC